MSDKPEAGEKKERVGILRKRDTTTGPVTTPVITKTIPVVRPKSTIASKPPNKPVEDGGSMFSKRSKLARDKPTTAPITRNLARASISACYSSTTLDSRVTATSQSSLSHKPGHRPSYLRNKSGIGSKNVVSMQVQCNKKQFTQIKKELTDIQNKAVDCYKRYRDSLVKLNKLNGQDEVPAIEDLKIVDFIERTVETPVSVALPEPTSKAKSAEKISLNNLKQITNEGVLSEISQEVQNIQTPSFKLLQEFTARLAELNNELKSTESTAESGDANLVPSKIQTLFDEIDKKILEEQEQQTTRTTNFMTKLKQVMINEEGTPVIMKDAIPDEYENIKKANEIKIEELGNQIKELELKKIHEEHKNADLAKAIINEQATVEELKCVLAQFESKRDDKEKEMERLVQKMKQIDLNNKRYEKLLESKTNEIALKDKSIADLKTNIKATQDKLTKSTSQCLKMENRMARADDDAKSQLDQLKSKYDDEVKACDKLRKELSDLNARVADGFKPLRDENEKLKLSEKELEKEVYNLKLSVTQLLHSKTLAEKEKAEEKVYRRELSRMEEEMTKLKTNIKELKEEVNTKEIILSKKSREIADLEQVIKKLEKQNKAAEHKAEITKLQDLNTLKTKENEQLQNDLNKALADLRLQEESLFMQQRLLKIRSELIHSLQDNEDTAKAHMAALNSEIDKKSYVVKQLNQEVSSKTEELENLFSTLGAKNLEVKRQDHIIKLLEETHDRNQRIRVKMEEKIARVENENAQLKQYIKYKA